MTRPGAAHHQEWEQGSGQDILCLEPPPPLPVPRPHSMSVTHYGENNMTPFFCVI